MSGYIPTEDEIETAFHEFASRLESESPGTYEHAPEFTDWTQAMRGFQRWRDQFRADAKAEALREAADEYRATKALGKIPSGRITDEQRAKYWAFDVIDTPQWLRSRADNLEST